MDDLFKEESGPRTVDYAELAHKFLYRTKIVLHYYWWLLPALIAIGISYKAIEGFLSDPIYKSNAEMIVSGRIALPDTEVYSEERDNFFGTQIALMGSGDVRMRAVERVKLTHPELYDAVTATEAYMRDGPATFKFSADVLEDTNIFVLSAFTPHPGFTRAYLDAIMEEYINRRAEMRSRTSERTFDAIFAQVEELETEIEAGEEAIVAFQRENNIVFIQEQGSAAGAYLSDLKRQLAELKTESRSLSSIAGAEEVDGLLIEQLQKSGAAAGTGALVDALGTAEENQRYVESKDLLETYVAQLEEFSIYLKPKHPKIINLKNEIERTENQLRIQRKQALDRIAERRQVVESRIGTLSVEIEIWEQTVLENGRLIAEFERLQSRLERSKAAYERSEEALRKIDQNQEAQQETVSVLHPAKTPYPAGTGMVKRFIQGGLYGFILAAGVLFILGTLENRILTASELSAHFTEPLLGAIPYEKPEKGKEHAVLLEKGDARYVFAEACRNLRTSVFFLGNENFKPSTFAVTSAIPNEGKSTVSANLAVALSFSRVKVLLVDADLRRGRLHKMFGLRRENGLAHILEGEKTLEEVVQKTAYEHLDFVSIGDHPEHPAELLMSDHMRTLIAEAKDRYEFIIFDTAPILATDDTTSFAGQLDGMLFTIRCAFTQVRQVKPAMARLRERNVDISGIILNYVDMSQPGYYYYRYSEYYSDQKFKTEDNKEDEAAPTSA